VLEIEHEAGIGPGEEATANTGNDGVLLFAADLG
jgi:hypothetical protein